MGLRNFIQNSPVVAVVAALVFISTAAALLARSGPQAGPMVVTDEAFYYDLTSGDLFTDKIHALPPIAAPGGDGEGVRAYVFTCGRCSDADSRFVVYLEKYTDQAKRRLQQLNPEEVDTAPVAGGLLVAEPTEPGVEPEWIASTSPDGMALRGKWMSRCDGSHARICKP